MEIFSLEEVSEKINLPPVLLSRYVGGQRRLPTLRNLMAQ
jgi:hypothetical protein